MKNFRVKYQKNFFINPSDKFQSEHIGIEADVDENEKASEIIDRLKRLVHQKVDERKREQEMQAAGLLPKAGEVYASGNLGTAVVESVKSTPPATKKIGNPKFDDDSLPTGYGSIALDADDK